MAEDTLAAPSRSDFSSPTLLVSAELGGIALLQPVTLWGAFSPVPHDAFTFPGDTPSSAISVHGRAERYKFHDAEVSTAWSATRDRGWRAASGAGYTRRALGIESNSASARTGCRCDSADISVGYTPVLTILRLTFMRERCPSARCCGIRC